MDINACRYLIELERSKTISAAARRLFIMQPTLTNYIKRLETELDVPLIVHGVSPIQFTDYGMICLKYAKEIVASEERMHECITAAKESRPNTVRIAVTQAGMTNLVNYIEPLQERFQHLDMRFLDGDSASCEERLLDGSAELAFFTSPVESSDVEYRRIAKNPMVLVVSPRHSLVKNRNVENSSLDHPFMLSARELQNQTFILTGPRTGNARAARQLLAQMEVTPDSILEFDSINTGFFTAASGGGIMFLSVASARRLEQRENRPVYCAVRNVDLSRYFIIARSSRAKHSPQSELLWKEMAALTEEKD